MRTRAAVRAVESIASGLGWTKAHEALQITGPLDRSVREACFDLGGTLAATLL